MQFPDNPSDGMIFESTPGIFYQYSVMTQSWYRVNTPSIPMATHFNDGLMSSEDFVKMTGLLVPPPSINLSFDDCAQTYDSGLVTIQGDDDGIIDVQVHEENLHENTGVIDFKIDTEELAQKLVNLGQLRLTAPQGDQGSQGLSGDDGANALSVGPQGEDGADGANAPWPGTLAEETFDVAQQNRAIVDISVNKVSSNENYLVVKRANIGNPDACPDTIIPQDIQSPWVLAVSTGSATVTQVISPVTGQVCGWSCNSDLYYFDMDAIVQGIYAQALSYLAIVKANKEALAQTWLDAMMELFNTQKSALCCALEASQSRQRNERTRQYLEGQRIQAAQGGYQLTIGADEDKEFPPLDGDGENAWNIAPTNYNLLHLSDPDAEVDWSEYYSAEGWGPANAFIVDEQPPLKPGQIPDAGVSASIPGNPKAAASASGDYTNGVAFETEDALQWIWEHDSWILLIYYCKGDSKFAARLVDSKHGDWHFGVNQNVTQCFQAGQLLNISKIEGSTFALQGTGDLVGGSVRVKVS